MIRPTRSSPVTILALCLFAGCAAPTADVAPQETSQALNVLEGPLGELVSDLMYGAPDARQHAAGELAKLGHDAAPATPHLISALQDHDVAVRALACGALGAVGGEADPRVRALNRCLLDDPQEGVQSAAADALVEIGDDSSTVLLEGMDHSRASVRRNCARALGKLEDEVPGAVDRLIFALDDPDARVRRNAIESIGRVAATEDRIVQPLIRSLGDDVPEVRAEAAHSLGLCGKHAKRAVLPLIDALRDEFAGVRLRSAEALGALGPDASQAAMDLNGALSDPDPKVAEQVAAALQQIQH